MNTVLTAASPDVFRNARLLGPFDLSFAMLTRDTFPQTMLYQNRQDCNARMEDNSPKTKAQKGTETDQVPIHFW